MKSGSLHVKEKAAQKEKIIIENVTILEDLCLLMC